MYTIRSCSLVENIDLDHIVTEVSWMHVSVGLASEASEVCLDILQYINISAWSQYQNKKKMQKNK